MARIYETPGVYFERMDASSAGIPGLRTDIAGFIGIAESGPRNVPVPIESCRQFEAYFGSFIGTGYLAYAVRAFFDNGGRRCWVVRVASDASASAGVDLSAVAGVAPTWLRIEAITPGVWGEELEVTFQETHRAQTKTVPSGSLGRDGIVQMTAGFAPHVLTRLTQAGVSAPAYRIIRSVDADRSRLTWDTALAVFDPTQPISVESVEYMLLVRRAGRLVRTYEGLSLVPGHPRFGPDLLLSLKESLDRRSVGLPGAPEPIAIISAPSAQSIDPIHPLDLSPFETRGGGEFSSVLRGGSDGLSTLRPGDFIGEEPAPEDDNEVRRYKLRGIAALNTVDEVAIVAIPDIHIRPRLTPPASPVPPCVPDPCLPPSANPPVVAPPRPLGDLPPTFSDEEIFDVQMHLVEQCESVRDRFAVLDAPYSAARNDKLGTTAIRRWRSRFDSTYGALYYPWLRVVDPIGGTQSLVREIPPSGHVAGVMARGDLEVGVHKAPANVELIWSEELTADVGETEHGLLNSSGINALRVFPGRGIRIFGARTLSSDPDWRFINVRRLLMMIEEAVDEGLQWVVFEPNDEPLWAQIRLNVNAFMQGLFLQGAFAGQKASDAYRVKCDKENNPQESIDRGIVNILVAFAPLEPAEFVVIQIQQLAGQSKA